MNAASAPTAGAAPAAMTGAAPADAAAGGDAAFAQDTSPPSSAVQSCCARELQTVQSDFAPFTQAAPAVGSRFRNLNLLIVGLNMAGDLLNKAKGIKDSFVAFKHAPNLQTAANLLQDLSSKIDST